MTTQTIYQNPQGKNEVGYIIDGKTYKDQAGTQRIDIGSVVPTQGGTYLFTGAGGVKTPGSIAQDIKSGYAAGQEHLGNAFNAQKNAINLATQNKTQNINRQREQANQRYADANRGAYQAYVQASNPYGVAEEQRARLGLSNSGYAESSKMQLANTYQQALAQNARDKNEYLNELDNALREAQYQGDIELANAIAQYENLVYKHGIEAAEAIAKQENLAFEAGLNMNKDAYTRYLEERDYADARDDEMWKRAYSLAQTGFSNAEIARILGVSESELASVVERRTR